jgi:hypothetical protein
LPLERGAAPNPTGRSAIVPRSAFTATAEPTSCKISAQETTTQRQMLSSTITSRRSVSTEEPWHRPRLAKKKKKLRRSAALRRFGTKAFDSGL